MSLKTNLFRFIFISVLGVLLHFTYEWSGDNAVVGLFSAVNESTWEHLKPEWAGLWSDFIRCRVCLAETTML